VPYDVVIRGTSEVLRVSGSPRDPAEVALAPLPGAALAIAQERIAYLGPERDLPPDAVGPSTRVIDAGGGFAGPGFVDPHTHLVFAGERSREFELRNRGATYLEIAQAGGGIASTVMATRAASVEELVALAKPRVRRLVEHGVTALEAKSGYGLSLEHELKMLRAIRRLSEEVPAEIVPTLLCAHAVPEEHRGSRERYVELCAKEIVPAAAREGLARACDAFTDQGAFTVAETRAILGAARDAGLELRLHADQLASIGAVDLAAELGARCVDHLEQVTGAGIAALARADVSAVLIPTSTLFLRMRPYAPGRKLRDAGVNVALGTNLNPGSAMSESVPLALGLACLENGLSPAEAYWAFTRGAAIALGIPGGRLEVGGPADVVVFSCPSYRHLPYHLGINHARLVLRRGRVVAENELPQCE